MHDKNIKIRKSGRQKGRVKKKSQTDLVFIDSL